MKLFVDTNIFLDLILKRERCDDAVILLNAIEKKIYEAVILDITILNIDYIAKKQVRDLREFLVLINSTFEVVGGSNKTIKEALKIPNRDLEDNLQYLCARQMKCDIIITNDINFYTEDIGSISSSKFIKKFL